MAVDNKLFTVAGITTHGGATAAGEVSERTKVRWGNDMVRLVKVLGSHKKIEDRTLGICLSVKRLDLVDLPGPMTKIEALQFLSSHGSFQSADDQFLIRGELQDRLKAQASEARRATLTVNSGQLAAPAKKAKAETLVA